MLFLGELWKARAESHTWPIQSLHGNCSLEEQLPQSDFLTLRILSVTLLGPGPRKCVPRSPQLRHMGSVPRVAQGCVWEVWAGEAQGGKPY